ncbi:T9SS type A sorting domain-containing protein [Bacteroidales bacterium]|nr:T9SS type A sorting domain-containing protein [Bacteroidales bacterium]
MKRIFLLTLFAVWSISALLAQPGEYAVDYDGINDYSASRITTGNSSTTMTWEFWFNFDDRISGNRFANLYAGAPYSSGTVRRRILPGLSTGELNVWVTPLTGSDFAQEAINTGEIITYDIWYHLAIVQENDTTYRVYLNGEDVGSRTYSANIALTGDETMYLGSQGNWDSDGENAAYVKMDEVRLWNTARTQEEINVNMYRELQGNESGLISYHKMSDGSGTTITDNSTNSYDGTLINGPEWISSGCLAGPDYALDFDGIDDYVDGGNNASVQISGTNITLEAWINVSSFEANSYEGSIIDKHNSSSQGYGLRCGGSGILSFNFGNGSSWNEITSPASSLSENTWHHIVGVYDGGTQSLYIDGELVASNNLSTSIVDAPTTNLRLGSGAEYPTRLLTGQIDEVRIWNVARTPEQIRENMMTVLTGDETGLQLYYRFDQQAGTILYDVSANGNNGTLTNMDAGTDWLASTAFNTWLGGEDNAGLNFLNWSRGVYVANDNIGITQLTVGDYPEISGSPAVRNLTVGSGVTISFSSNILIDENFIVNGTITLPSNASASTIGNDLLVSSGGTLTLQAGANVTINGNTSNAGTVHIESPANNGVSGSLITNGSISNTGTMSIERWVSNGSVANDDYTWHSMGLPITSALSGDYFKGDFMYRFNESAGVNGSWSNVVDTTNGITRTEGFIVKSISGDKTYTFAGTFNTGSVETANLSQGTSNYQLVSNPYPSPIDLETIDGTNIGDVFYVWDPTSGANGQYITYDRSDNSGSLGRYILPCQAFFVYMVNAGTISFENSDRTHANGGTVFKSGVIKKPQIEFEVSGEGSFDELFINYSDNENYGFKFFSMNPASPQIYANQGGESFCHYNMATVNEDAIVPIGFKTSKSGSYTIEVKGLSFADYDVYLKDKKAGTTQKLEIGTEVAFEHVSSNDENRFELTFKNAEITDVTGQDVAGVNIYPVNGAVAIECDGSANATIYNVSGQLVETIEAISGSSQIELPEGIYIVKAVQAGNVTTRKVIIR